MGFEDATAVTKAWRPIFSIFESASFPKLHLPPRSHAVAVVVIIHRRWREKGAEEARFWFLVYSHSTQRLEVLHVPTGGYSYGGYDQLDTYWPKPIQALSAEDTRCFENIFCILEKEVTLWYCHERGRWRRVQTIPYAWRQVDGMGLASWT